MYLRLFIVFIIMIVMYFVVYIVSQIFTESRKFNMNGIEHFTAYTAMPYDPQDHMKDPLNSRGLKGENINFSLTPKPVASEKPFPVYEWQKHRDNDIWKPVQYHSVNDPAHNLDTNNLNKNEKFVTWKGYDTRFFCNMDEFCKQFPDYELCPHLPPSSNPKGSIMTATKFSD